jgi:hypothetical protein
MFWEYTLLRIAFIWKKFRTDDVMTEVDDPLIEVISA